MAAVGFGGQVHCAGEAVEHVTSDCDRSTVRSCREAVTRHFVVCCQLADVEKKCQQVSSAEQEPSYTTFLQVPVNVVRLSLSVTVCGVSRIRNCPWNSLTLNFSLSLASPGSWEWHKSRANLCRFGTVHEFHSKDSLRGWNSWLAEAIWCQREHWASFALREAYRSTSPQAQ